MSPWEARPRPLCHLPDGQAVEPLPTCPPPLWLAPPELAPRPPKHCQSQPPMSLKVPPPSLLSLLLQLPLRRALILPRKPLCLHSQGQLHPRRSRGHPPPAQLPSRSPVPPRSRPRGAPSCPGLQHPAPDPRRLLPWPLQTPFPQPPRRRLSRPAMPGSQPLPTPPPTDLRRPAASALPEQLSHPP